MPAEVRGRPGLADVITRREKLGHSARAHFGRSQAIPLRIARAQRPYLIGLTIVRSSYSASSLSILRRLPQNRPQLLRMGGSHLSTTEPERPETAQP
jgi:hypothetical protein